MDDGFPITNLDLPSQVRRMIASIFPMSLRAQYNNLSFTEGRAVQFDVDAFKSSLRVGVPFDIQLHMKDIFGHPVDAVSDLTASFHCRLYI